MGNEMRNAIRGLVCIVLAGCTPSPLVDDGGVKENPQLAAQSLADGIPFVEALRWGMTEAEIKRAMPGVDEVFEQRGISNPPTQYRELRLPHVMIGDCPFEARLYFFNPPDDELTSVGLRYTGEAVQTCIDSTKALLIRRFGPRPHSRSTANQDDHFWGGPVTTVFFTINRFSDKTYLNIGLAHTGAPGTYLD